MKETLIECNLAKNCAQRGSKPSGKGTWKTSPIHSLHQPFFLAKNDWTSKNILHDSFFGDVVEREGGEGGGFVQSSLSSKQSIEVHRQRLLFEVLEDAVSHETKRLRGVPSEVRSRRPLLEGPWRTSLSHSVFSINLLWRSPLLNSST